jgi:hypothetical protein
VRSMWNGGPCRPAASRPASCLAGRNSASEGSMRVPKARVLQATYRSVAAKRPVDYAAFGGTTCLARLQLNSGARPPHRFQSE